jgi:Bacterial protein of unknown function (DUF885)
MRAKRDIVLSLGALLCWLGPRPLAAQQFDKLAEEFVFTSLSFSPTAATQTGLHRYTDRKTRKTISLDDRLDDFSPAELTRQREFYLDFQRRLARIAVDRLDPQTQVDYDLLDNAVGLALFSLDQEQFHRWKPQLYPENLGTALFAHVSLEYADTVTRARHLVARLEKVPAFLAQAMENLSGSNEIYRRVALESVQGVEDLVKRVGPEFVRGTPAAAGYAAAQGPALAALQHYTTFIRNELPKRGEFDWRMGVDRFDAKWKYYLQVSLSPRDMLRLAEDSLQRTRVEMLRLARPLHSQWFPQHRHDDSDSTGFLNQIVSEVLTRIGEEHTNRDSLLQQAQKDAAQIMTVVRDRRLLSLDQVANLRIIPTPPFMRGIYGVAGAVFAPALQPALESFYWVTPIPSDWPAERAEAKLREYNRYKMLTLTVHEAVPGHVVQGEYANRVLPEWRRLLRSVYGNTPYVEGWAVYTEHVMEAAGVNGGDPVKAHLTALKAMLRLYANAIIDIRLHTLGMSGEDAVTLMTQQAFQERPEAEGKLQRAQLDYVQLNTYLAGLQEWTALRRDAERAGGTQFNLCRYHDTVLLYGPIPVPAVRRLYMAEVAPTAKAPPSRCEPTGTR